MNDNELRGPQWQRLVAEYLAPRLGGTAQAWAEANKVVAKREFELYKQHFWGRADLDYLSYREQWDKNWLTGMAVRVGVDAPDGDACLRLSRETCDFVTRRVRSAYPGVVHAINELNAEGYTLYTASGEDSEDLAGYLEGMGVRERFVKLYGPDLVNTAKEGPQYYLRVFEDAGVAPGRAVVADDLPIAVSWAREAGATAVLVSVLGRLAPHTD